MNKTTTRTMTLTELEALNLEWAMSDRLDRTEVRESDHGSHLDFTVLIQPTPHQERDALRRILKKLRNA